MNSASVQFPTFRQFLWLFFMQPVTLHYRLKACGIEKPNATLRKLWFAQDAARLVKRQYVRYLFILLFLVTPIMIVVVSSFVLDIYIYVWPKYIIINFEQWVGDIITGVAVGLVFSLTVGLAIGLAFDLAGGVATGMTVGMVVGAAVDPAFDLAREVAFKIVCDPARSVACDPASGLTIVAFDPTFDLVITIGVIVGVITGVIVGVAISMIVGMVEGIVKSVAKGLVSGVAFGVALGVVSGVAFGFDAAFGVAVGVVFILCYLIFYLRLLFYPLEAIEQVFFYLKQKSSGEITLHRVPVLYHDLSYLPHPWLTSHLLLNAEHDPQLVKRVIAACRIAPGQRRAGERALGQLQAQELLQLLQHHRFDQLIELRGEWLPGIEGAPALLLTIREMGRYLQAVHVTSLPYYALQHLERAQQQYQALENQLLIDHSPLADAIKATLPTWQKSLTSLRQNLEALTQQFLPNPFRAGDPLSPESGQEVFRGRRDLVQRIESLLVDAQQRVSIALLGPRRTGKSSLLKMLPSLLPDAVCIFFDLQDNPVDSPASFFKALAQRAQEQARRDRYLTLPPLPDGTPFESGRQWLEQLDHLAIPQRILICLDEFERLETTFQGERRELLQLMGLFRATIQHRQRVRLLISGVAPFDELDHLWSDHFINLREVRIGHLDRPTALELLTQPIPDFPPSAIHLPLAEKIFARSGGLPYYNSMALCS